MEQEKDWLEEARNYYEHMNHSFGRITGGNANTLGNLYEKAIEQLKQKHEDDLLHLKSDLAWQYCKKLDEIKENKKISKEQLDNMFNCFSVCMEKDDYLHFLFYEKLRNKFKEKGWVE